MPANFLGVRRLACFCLSPLLLGGCADMLGLGGLTFDETDSEGAEVGQPGGAGGAVEQAGAGISLGGVPESRAADDLTEDFPRQIARDSIIATSPPLGGEGRYWIHSPSAGTLDTLMLNPGLADSFERLSWGRGDEFDALVATPTSGGVNLMGYDRTLGAYSMLFQSGVETTELAQDVGTHGRTHLVPLFSGVEWLTYVVSADTGDYRYYRPLPSEEADITPGVIDTGFTSFAPFALGGDFGILRHNSESGELIFERFAAQGEPLEQVARWNRPGTLMRTFHDSTQWSIVVYESGSGRVETLHLVQQDDAWELFQLEESVWPGTITDIAPLDDGGIPSALVFSAGSGSLDLYSLVDLDEQLSIVR